MYFKNKTKQIIQKYIGLFTALCFLLILSEPASAQFIFHIDASGPGNSSSILKTNIESGDSERLISSAPTFRTAHHIQAEDSVLLWTGTDVYKTGRDFKTYRLITTVEGSWSNMFTDIDTENQVMYYNFASFSDRGIYSLDLATGEADTVVALEDGDVVDIVHSEFGITYALHLGFGESKIAHSNFEGEADTLYSIETGSFKKVIVDESNEYIYFVHEESFSNTNLYRMNLDGSEVTLVDEILDNFSDLLIDETNQKLFIRYSNQSVRVIDITADDPEQELLFSSEYRIDRTFFDASRNMIVFFSLGGGIFDYDIENDSSNIVATFQPNEHALLLDEQNERIYYFVYDNAESAVYSMNFDGEDVQLVTDFTDMYIATDARDAKLDTVNNHIYFITRRAVLRIALEEGATEETLISYPFSSSTSLRALTLDMEREQLYLYKEDEGIYSLTFDGETETEVTTEGRFENNGLAYNPVDDKIYYTSNRHYMVNPDGSEWEEWPRYSTLEVDKIEFNVNRDQLLMAQQSVRFDDDMNEIYEERLRYLNFDEELSTGLYVNVPASGTFYDAITTFSAILPATSDSMGTSTEETTAVLPDDFSLHQNYPNPFNPSTVISYQLPMNSVVSLKVFDMLGREVATLIDGERISGGSHSVTFDAGNLASGMYIYRLQAGNQVFTKKLMLIK